MSAPVKTRGRLVKRILLGVLLGLVSLIVLLGVTVYAVGGSKWGRHKILAIALPAVEKILIGKLRIGALEGDIVHQLVLRDIELVDLEGQRVARLPYVGLRYNLLALVGRTLHVTAVDIKGAEVHVRTLKDGRLNVATLLRPDDTPPSTRPLPLRIVVSGIDADIAARFDGAPQLGTFAHAAAKLEVRGSLGLKRERQLRVDVDALNVHAKAPLGVEVALRGTLAMGLLDVLNTLNLKDVKLSVRTDATELNRLAPSAALHGPLALDADIAGPLSKLVAQLKLKLPRGDGQIDATVNVVDKQLPWVLSLALNGIDPQALRDNLPASRIDLKLHGSGAGPSGRIELEQLSAQVGKNGVRAHGTVVAPQAPSVVVDPFAAQVDLALELDARDLSELAKLNAPPLGGSLTGTVRVGLASRSLRASANLRGDELRGFETRIGRLQLDLDVADLRGRVRLATERVRAGGQLLSRVVVSVSGDRNKVQLRVDGDGPQEMRLKLALAAMPQLRGGHGFYGLEGTELTGVIADLTELNLRRGSEELVLTRPTQARVFELLQSPIAELDPLSLKLGALSLRVAGRFETKGQRLRAAVDADHIDIQQLVRVATGKTDAPKSQLALHANVSGSVAAPIGEAKLSGYVEAMEKGLPWRVMPALNASFANQRVQGKLSVSVPANAIDGQAPSVALRFNVPLTETRPLDVKLDASTGLKVLRKLLPPAARSLDGSVNVQLAVSGTLRRPQAELHVTLPKWDFAPWRGHDTALTVTYQQEQLQAQLASRFASTEDKALGRLQLEARTPLHLSSKVSVPALLAELRNAPSSVDVSLHELALPQILATADPTSQLPLTGGSADVVVQLRGPVANPTATVRVDAKDVRTAPGSQILDAPLGAGLSLAYKQDELGLTVDVSLDGKPLLHGKAGTTVRIADVLENAKAALPKLPLRAEVDVLPTPLPSGVLLQGTLRAHAELHGTVESPQAKADATGTALKLATWQIGDLTLHADADPHRALKAQAAIVQKPLQGGAAGKQDGSLALDATIPLPFDLDNADTKVVLRAQKFLVDYQAPRGVDSALGVAKASLDSDFSVKGGRPHPVIDGRLRLAEGQLSTAALPQLVRDMVVDLQARSDGMISLKEVSARIDQGHAKVVGNVQIVGGVLKHIWLAATTERVPIAAGPLGLWLDTQVKIEGETERDELKINVSIPQGTVRLPKLTSAQTSEVQPLGPIEDIRFIDARARRAAAVAAAEAKEKAEAAKKAAAEGRAPLLILPQRTRINVDLPGAFVVSGPEVRTDVFGHVEARVAATQTKGPVVTGEIRTNGGFLELMSRRYQIDRVVVSLSGATPPNPILDVSISRKLEAATIYVHVGGTAKKPKLSFRSDPPIYDEAQVLAIVVSGSDGKRSGTLQQQALGAISGLLIGQMKEKLGRAIPVDVIKLDIGNTDRSGATYSSMEVGKYLRDNLYLSYTHRFGTPSTILHRLNNDQIALEYYFRRSYQLNLMGGDQGVGALNLYWTKRF